MYVSTEAPVDDAYVSFRQNLKAPLPADEQRQLAYDYLAGDAAAGHKLVETNMPLVIRIAQSFKWSKAPWMDLLQVGNEGLCKALTMYDPEEDSKFTSYAAYWIRAKMFEESFKYKNIFKISGGRQHRKALFNVPKIRKEILKHKGVATAKDIASFIPGVDESVVQDILLHDMGPVYLDTPFTDEEGSNFFIDQLEDEDAVSTDAQMQARTTLSFLQEFGEGLRKERDRDIWFSRTVAEDGDVLYLVAERWGLTKERIRQVELILKSKFVDWVERHHDLDLSWTGW